MQSIPALELDECFLFLIRGGSAAQVISLLLVWPRNLLTPVSLSLLLKVL